MNPDASSGLKTISFRGIPDTSQSAVILRLRQAGDGINEAAPRNIGGLIPAPERR